MNKNFLKYFKLNYFPQNSTLIFPKIIKSENLAFIENIRIKYLTKFYIKVSVWALPCKTAIFCQILKKTLTIFP